MVNFRIVSKIIGQLLFLEGAMMLICVILSFCYREDDVMAFLISMILTVFTGLVFKFFGRGANNNLSRHNAYLVVTATWIIFSLFGMLPSLIGGYITNVTDGFFETMSGFTTTGATIFDDVESLPHGILFWRSFTHWIGGLGIVFFTIAILPSLVGGSMKVFAAEATGPIKSKMHPRLSTNAKWICTVYLSITIACSLSFKIAGMDWFDSINYSMSTAATGGFATHNDSIRYFHSIYIEYIGVLFQFLSGVNFTLLYIVAFKGKFRELIKNTEFRLFVNVIIIATAIVTYLLVTRSGYGLEQAFRSSLFQIVTCLTTTGLFNDDAGNWPHITWVIIAGCMFIGACAGSTSGGFKCIRGAMVLKVIKNEFRHILHPNAVLPVKINGQTVEQPKIVTLLAFLAIYILICLISSFIMIASGIDSTNAITISISCMGNVGPTIGTDISPIMSWSPLPDGIKWLCSALMLIGRLEIMTVLVLFTRGFWKDN